MIVRHFSWRKCFAKVSQIFESCKSVAVFFYFQISVLSSIPNPLYIFIEQRVQEYSPSRNNRLRSRSRKEVFQPHLPVRLPCYDLAPITSFTLGRPLRLRTSGTPGFHGLTGGVYKARERIHRAMADARLLANPASWSRVADSSPN